MSPPDDYPAAHSMDTLWFAIDADGHVAIFDSGEAGAVPVDAYVGEEGWGLRDALARVRPAPEGDDPEEPDLARRGVYVYGHSNATENWTAGPYEREGAPQPPLLRAEELPEEIRRHAVRFAKRFADTESIQPIEHWPSDAWGASWLGTGIQVVRPIPGKEKEYEEERADMADALEEYTWAPAAPRRRPWWKIW